MNVEDLARVLMQVLSLTIDQPRVFVNLSDYEIAEARVVGAVQQPGNVMVRKPADLVSVISQAGGGLPNADLSRVMIVKEKETERITRTVDIRRHLYESDPTLDPIRMESGALGIVPIVGTKSYIRVIGALRSPGRYIPEPGSTLLDMIYVAGGVTDDGRSDHIELISSDDQGQRITTTYDLEKLIDEGGAPIVSAGDVIIIERLEDWQTIGFWAEFARDLAILASSFLIFTRF